MTNPDLDYLLLGVNPFSNVNHYLREKARERVVELSNQRISQTLLRAFESGARGFNFASSSSGFELLKLVGTCGYSDPIGLYPMIPDTQSYVSAQLARGTMGVISDALGNLSWSGRAKAVFQGGVSLVTSDPIRVLRVFLDVEINKILNAIPKNCVLKSVLIHESLTDSAMALGASEVFRLLVDHISDNYKIWPGFVTRNFPFFVDFFKRSEISIDNVLIMTPFNKLGFQMTPSKEACEESLAMLDDPNVIGMSVFAGGQIGLREALQYITMTKNLNSVVVGVSNPSQAEATFGQLSKQFSAR